MLPDNLVIIEDYIINIDHLMYIKIQNDKYSKSLYFQFKNKDYIMLEFETEEKLDKAYKEVSNQLSIKSK